MLRESVLVIFLFSGAFSDECVTYTFEEGFNDLLNNHVGPCSYRMLSWEQREYSSIDIKSPNNGSKHFVSPHRYLSCLSSLPFSMSAGGVIEVTAYLDSYSILDKLTVMASKIVTTGISAADELVLAHSFNQSSSKGWETFSFQLGDTETFTGYITFMGIASRESTILVDSFRYIPANQNEDSCITYEDQPSAVTTESTVTEEDITTPTTVVEADTTTQTPTTQTQATSTVVVSNPTIPTVFVTEPTPVPTEPEIEFLENGCPVDPLVHWLVPDEKDCNLFYYCVWGSKVQRNCPSNLHFNPVIQVCDWPLSAGCKAAR